MFRGWFVVSGAFGVQFVGFGGAYAFTAFFDALESEFQASRAAVSLVFSVAAALYFTLGAFSGRLADRIDPRLVIGGGIVALALGMAFASRATSLEAIYLGYGLGVGVGVGFSYVPSLGPVQRWFVRKRGLASGLAVSGIGIGNFLVPPLAAVLIAAHGWRDAWLVLAIGILVLGLAATLLIEASPAPRGLHPDGDPAPGALGAATAEGFTLAEALRSGAFWRLALALGLLSFGIFVPVVHLVPYAQDLGLARAEAVAMMALIGAGSTIGRFALGGLADRLGRRGSLALMFAGMGAANLWWLVSTNPWMLTLFALGYGLFYGGFVALIAAFTADVFGARQVTGILGVLYSAVSLGTLLGPPLAGLAFDLQRSYAVPIAGFAILSFVAAALVATVPKAPPRPIIPPRA
ncbi:MAG: MFS transporter [Alphaproteobacteria bacterium]|nr:MFS transporter [Alphaproteobacteria bacterium]